MRPLHDHQIDFIDTSFERIVLAIRKGDLSGISQMVAWQQRTEKTAAVLGLVDKSRLQLRRSLNSLWRLPVLILSKASNAYDLAMQAREWMPTQEAEKVAVLNGDPDEILQLNQIDKVMLEHVPEMAGGYVWVVPYSKLIGPGQKRFREVLFDQKFLGCIYDQAEEAQSPTGQTGRAAHSIDALFYITITGEVVRNFNRPEHAYHLAELVRPGPFSGVIDDDGCKERLPSPYLPSRSEWESHWDNHNYKWIRKVLIDACRYTRIKRSDIGIPDMEIEYITVEPTPAQKKVYRRIAMGYLTKVQEDIKDAAKQGVHLAEQKVSINVLASFNRFVQALCVSERDMALTKDWIKFRNQFDIDDSILDGLDDTSAKIDFIKDFYQKMKKGDKLVVFGHFTKFLLRTHQELSKLGAKAELLYGATPTTPPEVRKQIEARFNSRIGSNVFIGSEAANAGLSLNGGCMKGETVWVIFAGMDVWLPGDFAEWAARPQLKDMEYDSKGIVLIAPGSIDEEQAARLEAQDKFIENIQDGSRKKPKFALTEMMTYADYEAFLRKAAGV